MSRAALSCVLTALLCVACGERKDTSGAVVVRQVLRGAEALSQSAPPPPPTGNAASTGPVLAPLGSTLVADTPHALYRQALEQARRDDGSQTARARLNALEAELEEDLDAEL